MNPLLQGAEQTALPGRLNAFYLEGRAIPIAIPLAQQLGLRDGQVIQAAIEMRGETLTLLYNGQLLELPPGLRFRPGEQVWLRANRSAGGWTLRPVDPQAATPTAAPADPEPSPALSRLLTLSLRPPTSPTLLQQFQPQVLNELLAAAGDPELMALFQRAQLSMRGLSPGALQGAVLSSGLWLEALLGRGRPASPVDAKALLRKLMRALGDKEPGKIEPLKRAIDDIEAAQADSLAAQARGELSFAMVLPFADANPVEIKFFRPPRRPGGEPPPFSVDIHTDNDVLGKIWLKTSVARAAHVDLVMWAVKASVARLAQRHADALGRQLSRAGLKLESFRVFNAPRPQADESRSAPGAMLDVVA